MSHEVLKPLCQMQVRNERCMLARTIDVTRKEKPTSPHQKAELYQYNGQFQTHASHYL